MPTVYEQAAPFCVQIELAEGCNLRCTYCGLNGIRGKKDNDFKFMKKKTAKKLAKQIKENKWNARLEFAMHGEPSLNPNRNEILRIFRETLPKSHMMMTSNGGGFLKNTTEQIDECLKYLNVLALDNYEYVKIVPKILENYEGEHQVRHYPEDNKANPHTRKKLNERLFVIVKDISSATSGTHSTLNNHAGCGSPKNDKADGKRCAKPFREISVRYDGSIAICCNDWRGYYKCGNILETNIGDIWQGKEFSAARKKLYNGMRDFGPCEGCDALSYRPGLLPDQRGKLELPKPNEKDLNIIDKCISGKPYTKPVLRTWEITK